MIPRRSGPDPGDRDRFPPALAEELQTSLQLEWDSGPAPGGRLERALQRAAADARERGLRPEELLLALKDVEAGLPEALRLPHSGKGRVRIVRALLEAYFR